MWRWHFRIGPIAVGIVIARINHLLNFRGANRQPNQASSTRPHL